MTIPNSGIEIWLVYGCKVYPIPGKQTPLGVLSGAAPAPLHASASLGSKCSSGLSEGAGEKVASLVPSTGASPDTLQASLDLPTHHQDTRHTVLWGRGEGVCRREKDGFLKDSQSEPSPETGMNEI